MSKPVPSAADPPYTTAEHIARNDPILTARTLMKHMGKSGALTRALHGQFQAAALHDERARDFWVRVQAAILNQDS